MRYSLIAVLGFSLFITSCGITNRFTKNSAKETDPSLETGSKIEEGMASWYGPDFHGNLTANGEIYNMHELTAAHRTLPFGTILRVKNLDNGKSVIVRINDRGPYAKDRIIDLSKKAAMEIGMIGPGTAHVSLILLEGQINEERIVNLKTPTFTVQLASFYEKDRAVEFSQKIKGARVETFYLEGGNIYRVYFGTFTDENKAKNKQQELKQLGFTGYVKQIQNY
ncbi:MAG TPA: septal ring lytic transglycosylase RlpA family protein [Balneolaceae bacterium]|nr:septal ring lytic transglycosylase RlpA family protein [Balneolaceae bacterium]